MPTTLAFWLSAVTFESASIVIALGRIVGTLKFLAAAELSDPSIICHY